MNQLLELFQDLKPLLRSPDDFTIIKVELATIIDAAKPFIQGTYKLKGRGLLALECYEIISSVTTVEKKRYPNVQAVISSVSDSLVQEQLRNYAFSYMKSALDYYKAHLQDDMMNVPLNAFKAARLFSPRKLPEMNPDIETVEQSLFSILFITVSDILALKNEYPQYVAVSKDVSIHYG